LTKFVCKFGNLKEIFTHPSILSEFTNKLEEQLGENLTNKMKRRSELLDQKKFMMEKKSSNMHSVAGIFKQRKEYYEFYKNARDKNNQMKKEYNILRTNLRQNKELLLRNLDN